MARRQITRRMSPGMAEPTEWLIYIGADCAREERVIWPIPDETYARRVFRIPPEVPVLIGRP